jgi:hypothetical protein
MRPSELDDMVVARIGLAAGHRSDRTAPRGTALALTSGLGPGSMGRCSESFHAVIG